MDGALGFNTFEKQDKVLVGLNGGMDAAVTVRILQGWPTMPWRPRRTPPRRWM